MLHAQQFTEDLDQAYQGLQKWGIDKKNAHYFLPPYEWYNDSIAAWTSNLGLQLINFSPGTRSNADYTYPGMGTKYVSTDTILKSIYAFEKKSEQGLNGFILLTHIGTDPGRTDKMYYHLSDLIVSLKTKGYHFVKINELLD